MNDPETPRTETEKPDVLWRRGEFDRGYKAGYEGAAYSPTSLPYIEGYESGERSAQSQRGMGARRLVCDHPSTSSAMNRQTAKT